MRYLSLAVVLCASLAARAEDTTPHNPLTEKEIAEGWIALFDGKTTFGWTSPNDSKWTIVDGMMAPQKGKQRLLVTTTPFSTFSLELEVRKARDGSLALSTCC